ncbi:pseudouridine synthase, RluA family [Leptotrichia sp. oral taxon 215 str. W9775]|uniref:RluA family pseudouridine synthase n=1 Tax=Leptotrichia sp. oral taxon 215 TaxID=712359 RepID=UPI0003AD7AE9|nr:RluA family pseudouridine synthase [Leptotrichia sp. oral taxon 215]ERK66960.1 pseudouridine synthase, RluA family [Leptotrichia sp. oral taxon 215 str. W9775]
MEIFEYVVDSETEGMRIDRYLKKTFKHEPLSKIFQALRKGDVKVGGKKVKENYRLSLNERISVKYLKAETASNENKNFKKNKIEKKVLDKYKKCVIFENEDFFIVNKEGNIPMHKGTGHEYGLSEIFKEIYNSENINFANRLDYETSGLVIGCKTLKFLRYISEKIRNNEVRKKYIAVVHGIIEEEKFTIENYLLVEENGVSVTKNKTEGKKSITEFRCIGRKTSRKTNVKNPGKIGKTALDINLVTGRKHQIRAQISDYGYPIVGDRKYGKNDKSDILYLCCYYVAFDEYEYEIEKKFLNNQFMW